MWISTVAESVATIWEWVGARSLDTEDYNQ